MMNLKPPADRRKFANTADNIRYFYHKLLFWLYQRQDARRARSFSERLERLLTKAYPKPGSIFAEECWSLVHEAKGDLAKAIKHREKEVKSIRRLHEISVGTPGEDYVLAQYNTTDLSDRLDLLAILYHDIGKMDRAMQTLQESKQYCADHGIEFDGEDILQEYLEELGKAQTDLSA